MSKQMAFHIGQAEILKMLGIIYKHGPGKKDQTLGDIVDAMGGDDKRKDKLRAVYVAMDQCVRQGQQDKAFRMKKITAWRTADPEKFDLETDFDRSDPTASMLKAAGLMD